VRTGNGLAINLRDSSDTKTHEQIHARLANKNMLIELPNRHWLTVYVPSVLRKAQEKIS